MKSLEKKLSGIYIPGYRQVTTRKFDSSQEDMIPDVLDTDEDKIMYQYKSLSPNNKNRSQSKQSKSFR